MQTLGKKKKNINQSDICLLDELYTTKKTLDDLRQRFDYVTEPEMISSCIYEMRSVQERYSYLLSKVREKDISEERGGIAWKG